MAAPRLVEPVKRFVAVLWLEADALDAALTAMQQRWGPLDYQSIDYPFDFTSYYEPEMGTDLQRRLVSFAELMPSETLVEAKLTCNAIEDSLAGPTGRRINLDIGYLDHNKLILASAKGAGQKIHLGEGIYADLIARYARGHYQPFEWTFMDFKSPRYTNDLNAMRELYLAQLRRWRSERLTSPE